MKMTLTAIRVSVELMLMCGLIYPLVTTSIAQIIFPKQAGGSLIQSGGSIIGSELLAQNVQSPKLFHPRASAAKYDPTASVGSRAVDSHTKNRQLGIFGEPHVNVTELNMELIKQVKL